MANRPLLIFPSPAVVNKTNKTGFGGPLNFPSKRNQISKFDRKITELERVLENRSAFLQQGAVNIIPEMILVLETAGEVSDFFKAVRKTPGMEFLAEYQQEIEADDSFYILDKEGNKTNKPIDARFYLTLTNQTALRELVSYWNEYKKDPNQQHFRRGTTKFRTLFEQLKDIRPYSLKDRIIDTGIEEYINELKSNNVENVKFEIELIYKGSSEQNEAAFNEVVYLLSLNQGNVVINSRVIIPEIFYHAFIAEAPIQSFDDLSESTAIRFLKSDQILFFRPVGQLVALSQECDEELPSIEEPTGLSSGNPIVALLDGLPLQNHALLQDRLIIDDPFNFSSNYLPQKRLHGTAMASLILHGDLNDANSYPLSRPIYVCPIMKPDVTFEAGEFLPNDKLPLDIIHTIVKRLKEGDDTSPAIAPDVKIINFSIGDSFRPFQNNLSSWAKLIDWLSFKYDLLFIVSAGNYSDNFVLNINSNDFDALNSNQIQNISLQHIVETNFNRKILTPAESINSLTVGASHFDYSEANNLYQRINLITADNLISPISRIGFGYKKSIKPEILMPGGRKLYRKQPIQDLEGKTKFFIESQPFSAHPPGNKAALPGPEGSNNSTGYLCGTSNATALASRLAAQIYDVLVKLNQENTSVTINSDFFTVIIKSMLVHGASWDRSSNVLEEIIQNLPRTAANTAKRNILPYIGYGRVNAEKILFCTDQRVTLIGYGQLLNKSAHLFNFPIPPSIGQQRINKKLVVTLAYNSPLNFQTRKYRKAQLYFDNISDNSPLTLNRSYYDFRTAQSGTVQHDILEGDKADVFIDGDAINIKVNCREDAGGLTEAVKYGLCVTFEVQEQIPIYDEIQQRIIQRVRPNV